jgi:hypothetical protein
VADLKDRLVQRLQPELPEIAAPPISELVLAEVDVDVVF